MIRLSGAVAAFVVVAGGCMVPSDPCGKNQQEFDGLFEGCVCVAGAVPQDDGTGCRLCGDHEEVQGTECVCAMGFERGADDACVKSTGSGGEGGSTPTGRDMPCSSDADCADFDADYCTVVAPDPVCAVNDCMDGTAACAGDRECCDFSALAPALASVNGLCVPIGECEANFGTVVTP